MGTSDATYITDCMIGSSCGGRGLFDGPGVRPQSAVEIVAVQLARCSDGVQGTAVVRAGTTGILRRALGATVFDRAADEGARLTLDQAVEYARRARGRRRRPATGWSSLTPTELQVAGLVAEASPTRRSAPTC